MPLLPVAVMPMSTNPAWAMLEYASIRLMSVCAIANTLPTTIETAARTHSTGVQSQPSGWNATLNTRMNAANAATLRPADMKAVTAVGAPWYTSGVHIWNGTAETLNPNPIARSTMAASASAGLSVCPASALDTADSRVDPVAPYAIAMP